MADFVTPDGGTVITLRSPPSIAAALCWYDEPLESLDRCVRSVALVADVLVVADGRWQHFEDHEPVESPPEQQQLVKEIIRELGIRHWFVPALFGVPWPSQVAKRSAVYSIASRKADWTFVIDADEYVEYADRAALHTALTETDRLTAHVGGRTIFGPSSIAGVFPYPRLFSSARGGLHVEGSHNGVRNSSGDWLTGDPAYVPIVETIDVSKHLQMFHAQGADRPRERELADRRYRTLRRRQNVEGWPSRATRA